jgi:hypothetical protein
MNRTKGKDDHQETSTDLGEPPRFDRSEGDGQRQVSSESDGHNGKQPDL